MKFCSYRVATNILNLAIVGYCKNDGVSIRMLRATRFYSINHNPQNISSNKVDAPFVRPESRVTRNLLDDDDQHNNEPYHESNEGRRTTEEATDYVANKAKRGTRSVVETAFNVGEKLAEGMQQTFGVIKETTQKVKDTIVGMRMTTAKMSMGIIRGENGVALVIDLIS